MHEVLTKLKAQPNVYPQIDLSYSSSRPLTAPVVLNLPANGFRLRFDGPEQRLRLIEVLDFKRTQLQYKNVDFVKVTDGEAAAASKPSSSPNGPAFRHVYGMMGPTFPGEYLPPEGGSKSTLGIYVLSYPGIAFSFPLKDAASNSRTDHVSLLSSPAASPVKSLAIFEGSSWNASRDTLFEGDPPNARLLSPHRAKDHRADEIDHVKILGRGKLDLYRRTSTPFRITLSQTTAQDLIVELGPPDAIYRKSDRRLAIHRSGERRSSERSNKSAGLYGSPLRSDGSSTNTDRSSTHAITDESDDEANSPDDQGGDRSAECFYNYFHHGLDVLISHPASSSPAFPSSANVELEAPGALAAENLVATKVLLHGNVPGSYPFNRHRRMRWEIDLGESRTQTTSLCSEASFPELSKSLQQVWKGNYGTQSEEVSLQKGMVLNRGWGDSPGSSCELLGGWEESADTRKKGVSADEPGSGNTELFGFPGLVFEVLKNGAVSCLTVY